MEKQTYPAQPGDLIQILELHPGDAYNEELETFKPLEELVTVVYNAGILQVKAKNGHKHTLLSWDNYPAYTIHRRAGATKDK